MKLFKLVAFFICVGFISNSISFGQSGTASDTITTGQNSGNYKEITESLQLVAKTSNKINDVSFYFCNSGLEYKDLTTFLEIDIRPGETKNICMVFANKSDEKFEIIAGFTTGNISKPSDKVYDILCETDITGKNTFTKLIQSDFNNEFILSGKEIKVKKFSIKTPRNITGSIYSCGMFKIKGNLQEAGSGSMFNIEAVKKMPIQINITGDVYHYGFLTTITDNKQNILKGFIAIVGLRLIISIIQASSKKKKRNHKK